MATSSTRVQRLYGISRSLGDVLQNSQSKDEWVNLDFGFLGLQRFALKKEGNEFALLKSYKDNEGNDKSFSLGKLFEVKDKSNNATGLYSGSFGLYRIYSKDLNKQVTLNNDCVVLTLHFLKEPRKLGESEVLKIGYITGQFAIEQEKISRGKENE